MYLNSYSTGQFDMNSFHSKHFVHVLCNDATDKDGVQIRAERACATKTLDGIVSKIEYEGSTQTRWHFTDECPQWFSYTSSIDKIAYFLTGIASLKKEGLFCTNHQKWKRNYVTRHGKLSTYPNIFQPPFIMLLL
jgi:hypothetical protein